MQYYTIKEIADRSGVSKTSVRRHMKKIEEEDGAEQIKQHMKTNDVGALLISEVLAARLQELILNTPVQKRIQQRAINNNAETVEQVQQNGATDTGTHEQNGETNTATHNGNAGTQQQNGGTIDRNAETVAALNTVIDTLTKQIDILTAQLNTKDEQIKELNERLSELAAALSNAQTLHAAELSNRKIETGTDEEKQLPFIFRIFKRK